MMGREARAKEGYYHGGDPNKIMIGYDYVDGNLIINEYEAECVKYIFSSYLKGKGFRRIHTNSSGDLIFTVQVQTPKKLTKEQRELFVELAKTMNEQPPVKKRGFFG